MSRVNTPLLDEAARTALEKVYKHSSNHTLRQRCQAVLLKALGRPSLDVGQVVGLCRVSVDSWVKRYVQEGINGLKTKPGRGRKPVLTVTADQGAVRSAVEDNRQRISLAKAEWESQRAAGEPPVGRDAFRAFLKVLVADINVSDDAQLANQTRCATLTGSNACASSKR
ncbi:MAG: helix-turn-helix domain-containing protein [Janthinobacterium lividum]